jgi:hypothetical protein
MWIELDEGMLTTRLSSKELEKLRVAAAGEDEADPVQDVFDQVTRKVRSRVRACKMNKLGAAGTIPDELLDDALALCVVKIMTRPGGLMIDPEGQRAKDADRAEENLDKAAKGLIAIEQPAVEGTEVSGPVPGRGGSGTRIKMRGEG